MKEGKYYYLKEGDIIKEGDEVEMSEGLNAPVKWVKTKCVGQKAPSPLYISHRKYRRKNLIMENTVSLICDCGVQFTRPQKYIVWNSKSQNVMWRWKLKYCDDCYKKRTEQAMSRLPEIIAKLAE
jgi:hypothetical protein